MEKYNRQWKIVSKDSINIEPTVAKETLAQGLEVVKENLADFLTSPDFETKMRQAFGQQWNLGLGKKVVKALASGEELPEIIVVPAEQMNGVNGGFDSVTGTLYLADSTIAQSPDLADVLTEELGHYIDSRLNEEDSPGDEGELLARLVRGDELSEGEIGRLKQEDDKVEIFDGEVEVEANGEVSFSEPTNFDAGDSPDSVAVGEFNGDGFSDLATANGFFGNVSVLLGNGDGSFGNATNFDVGEFPASVAVGEFNGDGFSDLVVASNGGSDNVSVLLGNGDGSFGNATNFDLEDFPWSVAVGEFNDDAISDLVVANGNSQNVSVLLGNGDGSFGNATNFDVGDGPRSVAVGEFNGDGFSDLVVANGNSQNISVLLGNGDGSFGNATNFKAGDGPWSVAVGEFNDDAISDLVVQNGVYQNISVLLGNGDGSFGNATNFDGGGSAESVAVGEFNGDEVSDLAFANWGLSSVSILLNTTTEVIPEPEPEPQPEPEPNFPLLTNDNDVETLSQGDLDDFPGGLLGLGGSDRLTGSADAEVINGNRGNDTLNGAMRGRHFNRRFGQRLVVRQKW